MPALAKRHGDAAAHRAGADDRGARRPARGFDVGGQSGTLRGRALGEEDVALRLGLRRRRAASMKVSRSRFGALVEGHGDGRCAPRDDAGGGASRPRDALGQRAGERRRRRRLGRRRACRRGRARASAGACRRPCSREGDGVGERIAARQITSTSPSSCAFSAPIGSPVTIMSQRLLRADHARQALGAAGAGQQADLHLGQAELRFRSGDAEMAAERQLQPAAEGRAWMAATIGFSISSSRRIEVVQARGFAAACRTR